MPKAIRAGKRIDLRDTERMMNRIYPLRIIAVLLLLTALTFGLTSGVLAQDGGLSVTILQVDSEAFPRVTVYVAVSDENGLPLTGLTETSFEVTEKGKTPAKLVAVESDTTQSIGVVLALDISVVDDALAVIQKATQSFIDTLGSNDKVAVIAFSDKVQVVQEFAGCREASEAIGDLTTGGSYTSLNEAALKAATLASESSLARRAVIVLTDSTDNAGGLALDETLSKVEELGVPIHVIGFGPKMARPGVQELKSLAEVTGGQFSALSVPEGVQVPLKAMGVLLHQGYEITFESRFKADNKDHDFSIGVTSLEKTGRVEGRFVALPGTVTVRMPDLDDGQTVGGIVNLTALVTAPAPVASVEYLLGGQLLAKAVEPPYSFAWDSTTVEPGSYVLVARASDDVGNEGEAEVRVDVALPVVVTEVTSPSQVEPGQDIVVEVRVTALEGAVRVEFMLDGRLLGSDDAPGDGAPYRFSFDSGGLAPGEHIITVRAEDVLGRRDEASVSVHFLAPPTPVPTPVPTPMPEPKRPWFRFPLVNGIVAATAFAVAALTAIIVQLQRKRRQKVIPVEIHNLGNTDDRYQLRVDGPGEALKFRWSLHGASLIQQQVIEAEEPAETVENEVEERVSARPSARSTGAGQGARKVMDASGTLAGILGSIGTLLPRSMSGPFRSASTQLRRGRSKVIRAEHTSSRVSRTFKSPSSKAKAKRQAKAERRAKPQRRGKTKPTVAYMWSQTPVVESGEILTVDLLIDPVKPSQTREHTFKVFSRSIEQEDAPLVIKEQRIQFVGISWFRRFLPLLIVFVIAAAILVTVFQLVNTGVWVW